MSGPGPATAPGSPRAGGRGLGGLLRRLRDSEAERLELERKLVEYRKSDEYLMKLKYMKLKKYLKEIDERQKGAILRNQTFLKEFDQFEAHMIASTSEIIQKMEEVPKKPGSRKRESTAAPLDDSGTGVKEGCGMAEVPRYSKKTTTIWPRTTFPMLAAWFGREIKSVLSLQEDDLSAEGDKEEEYNKQASQDASDRVVTSSVMHLGDREGQSQRQSSRDDQYPNAPKTPMLRFGRRAGIDTKAAVPRGLYHPATDFMGRHTSAVLDAGGLGMQQKLPQPTKSCPVLNPRSCSPSLQGLGPESRSADLESDASVEGAARCGDLAAREEGSEQLISSASDPKPAAPEEEWLQGSVPGSKPCPSNLWTCKEASWESSVELPVPASAEEVMPSTPGVLRGTASPAASWERGRGACTAEGSLLQPPNLPAVRELPLVSSAPDRHRGTLAGLCHVLQLVEDVVVRAGPQHRLLYQGEHLRTMGAAELLSFCNRAESLKEDDLEACEAVVLHQLRALLQSMLNGCLLPEKTLDAKGRAMDEKKTRPDQQWDMDMLRTCLSSHALFLKKHQVQLTEEVAEMFERLLASSKKAQDGQTVPVLREVIPEECGDRSSVQSNESSCSLPSIPNDGGELKQAKHTPQLAGTGEQEVASWCEDESKEESPVEKIPITGWDSGDNSSKANESQEVHSETCSSSNERSPPFSRTETTKGVVTAIKSKAFWGESDDSSSEIEAALRPQTHGTEGDEFDDFYD